jgi:hypothetical protein
VTPQPAHADEPAAADQVRVYHLGLDPRRTPPPLGFGWQRSVKQIQIIAQGDDGRLLAANDRRRDTE